MRTRALSVCRNPLGAGLCAILILLAPSAAAQDGAILLGMGDSLGEAVQSADASWRTQPASYLNWIAYKLGVPFALPLIQSGPFAVVGETSGRFRLFPSVPGMNLSVSGADVRDVLETRADAASPQEFDSETDLVLFPRRASQIEIAEMLRPLLVICWIGNNDVLGTALSWQNLDASQATPVDLFRARYRELVERLGALGSAVVLANVPNVTRIGFLIDRDDLRRFLGNDLGLPPGHYTSLPALFLIRLGLAGPGLVQDPRFVLDPDEIAHIEQRILAFNTIIAEEAATIGAPVVDVHGLLEVVAADPPVILGVPLTTRFLGGLLSLDGVHPSNIGHAVIAHEFLRTINARFGTHFPLPTEQELLATFLADPFVDKDGDGRVAGRPFAGLLETLGPFLGVSGDANDLVAEAPSTLPPTTSWKKEEVLAAFEKIWGPRRRRR